MPNGGDVKTSILFYRIVFVPHCFPSFKHYSQKRLQIRGEGKKANRRESGRERYNTRERGEGVNGGGERGRRRESQGEGDGMKKGGEEGERKREGRGEG